MQRARRKTSERSLEAVFDSLRVLGYVQALALGDFPNTSFAAETYEHAMGVAEGWGGGLTAEDVIELGILDGWKLTDAAKRKKDGA